MTYKEGTYRYMSPEMHQLNAFECGKVDLYYNDLWGLKTSMDLLEDSSNSRMISRRSEPMIPLKNLQAS